MPWQRKMDYDEVRRLLREGLTLRAIADRLGVSKEGVSKGSKLLGIKNPRGRPRKVAYEQIFKLRAAGLTYDVIAARLGVSRSTVVKVLRAAGRTGRADRGKG